MDEIEKLPVYLDGEKIGSASSESGAARLIRKHIAETQGDGDTGITAADVIYSPSLRAYKLGEE